MYMILLQVQELEDEVKKAPPTYRSPDVLSDPTAQERAGADEQGLGVYSYYHLCCTYTSDIQAFMQDN